MSIIDPFVPSVNKSSKTDLKINKVEQKVEELSVAVAILNDKMQQMSDVFSK